ncbi:MULTISPECIES: hypothetical protein [Cellulophaga]|uniref:Uncharacterized protein n=1 Tax=Cellulophaga baltica TaxID=76594 RepID=A0A1G7D3V5_9FLAO|nr:MULTISPECIES: hypothetical protein [Cellulophaga]WFO14665.1 hypothetical protein M601_011895 [Cellulophaga baltica 4]AIY12988.1 hypothetical protein M667_07060 [Cellulophaga baltica NN016038]KGK32014.1 hypothetical protein EL45_01650 [Cellulophaga sp. E6(2014)]MBA6313472.1 hypothetical protein [Cellulophaga baltica]MCR1023556.1 hypothetical protein [Cellulophaga baltica]
MKTYIKQISILFFLLIITSCESDKLEAITTAADGGGTLTSYIAYTIDATDPSGTNVYGRVVFWKNSLEQTLVQISVYNTETAEIYPALILEGAIGSEITTLEDLGTVSGDTGELSDSKFYVISDTTFYDSILTLDAHISIYLNTIDGTLIAEGGLGSNAEPVEQN